MSVEVVVPAVAAGNSQQVPAVVVDDVNEHTPDAHVPGEEKLPEVPTPQDGGIAELREVVEGLSTAVTALTSIVTGQVHDESPTSRPWTHRGGPLPHGESEG